MSVQSRRSARCWRVSAGRRGRGDLGEQKTDRERRDERYRERGEGDCRELRVRANARRKLVQEEASKAACARRRLAVDEGVPRGDEIVQTFGRRIQSEVAARDGQVAARAPVETAELEHVVRREALDTAVRLEDQIPEARPARAAVFDETVDRRHGPNVSPLALTYDGRRRSTRSRDPRSRRPSL